MTEQNPEEYEDVYPLLGAIGPYLNFTTGHMNPVDPTEEDFAEHADDSEELFFPEDLTEPWEDEEN